MKSSEYLEDVTSLQDQLLHIIEVGDAVDVLAEEYTASLNELMKAELIEIRDDKVQLTDKGRHAREMGIKNCLQRYPEKAGKIQVTDFAADLSRSSGNRSLLIVLFFLLLSLVVIIVLLNFQNTLG